ncbi:MAG: Flp pilus assembly protein CpaB [Planctomycetota bacterium]
MKAKTLILLFVALGCGMIAAVAVSKAVMDNGSGKPTEPMAEIFVAVTQLDHNARVTANNVKVEKWPKARLPEGAIFALEQIEDKFAKQVIFPGEPILEKKINDSRGGFSTTIPEGHRVFDISCNSSYIKPGDYVDILGTFSNGRNAPPESRTVMQHVKVHGINGQTTRENDGDDNGKAPAKGTFNLMVKESELEALKLADKMGELTLHLRPFTEDHKEESIDRDFLDWINSETVEEENSDEPAMFTAFNVPSEQSQEPELEPVKHTMVIVSPNGVQEYEWTDADEIPTAVTSSSEDLLANTSSAASSNVYSGYGDYPPTYPVGMSPNAPPVAPAGDPAAIPPATESPTSPDGE